MEKSAREGDPFNKWNLHIALNMFNLTLLRDKVHGTDQDPLCEQQQWDFIFVVVLNTGGMFFTKDFSSSGS